MGEMPRATLNMIKQFKLDSFCGLSFEHRRCLVPVSSFYDAEGPKDAKGRIWFDHPDGDELVCAGI